MARRPQFRPDALEPLESRAVPSHLVPLHRVIIPMPTISSSSPAWSAAPLPGHRYPTPISANVTVVPSGADPAVKTIEIRMQNQGNSPVTSATVTERLPRSVTYIAGTAEGQDVGPVEAVKVRGGGTVLRWTFQSAVAPGAYSVISFRAR
jgi:uncharacterized repeat protein (TIGR01451 family)